MCKLTDVYYKTKNVPLFDRLQPPRLTEILFPHAKSLATFQSILTITWVIAVCTILGMLASTFLDHENVIMIYLLGVAYLATRCSFGMSMFACLLSVLSFDFFVVPPAFTMISEDPQYAFTFAIMFVVALAMSGLTHKVKAQKLLIKQAELLDHTYDAIMVWDLNDYKIAFWNSGAEKMLGLRKDQAIGQSMVALLCAEYPGTLGDIVTQVKIDGWWNGEITYTRFDGAQITVASRWTVKLDPAGNPDTIVEFATDITERKSAALRVKEFYSTVSHELRTPLTSIKGGLTLLEHGVVEPNSSQGAKLIFLARTQCDKLTALINDMLDLQKIEAGKFQLDTSQLKADTIIRSVVAELAVTAAEVNTSFAIDIQANPTVEADSARIAQVLTNLLANAVKFSPPGSEIHVTTETREDRLRISVIDNGPGIEPDQMHKLFGKFQQLDSSDTREHGGTGLGLAISKAIVEQHRGEIGADSEAGKGSTFWFELRC
jgi:PAS domain S-box-containing protein